MPLGLALDNSPAGRVLWAGLVVWGIKLAEAAIQVASRGKVAPDASNPILRGIYLTGKITPFVGAVLFAIAALLRHQWAKGGLFCFLALVAVWLARKVIALRKQGSINGWFAAKQNG